MRREIFARLRRVIKPDGYLILGGVESVINIDDSFQRHQDGKAVYYQLRTANQQR